MQQTEVILIYRLLLTVSHWVQLQRGTGFSPFQGDWFQRLSCVMRWALAISRQYLSTSRKIVSCFLTKQVMFCVPKTSLSSWELNWQGIFSWPLPDPQSTGVIWLHLCVLDPQEDRPMWLIPAEPCQCHWGTHKKACFRVWHSIPPLMIRGRWIKVDTKKVYY